VAVVNVIGYGARLVTVGIYVRISEDRYGERVGVQRQRRDCTALAAARWPDEPVVVFEDDDRSAYRGKRPAWARLLRAIEVGEVDAVVGYNVDRMVRQPRELEQLIDLCTVRRLSRVVTAQGDLDLTTHDGQLQARILVAVARKSSDDTSRRVSRAARDRAEAGLFHGGPVPYGFRSAGSGQLAPVDEEIRDIRAMAAGVLAGVSINRLARDRPEGMPGPRMREAWRQLLLSPVYRGRNAQGVPAVWPVILDPFTATRLTELLSIKNPRKRPNQAWPLSRIAVCSVCEGGMYGQIVYGRSPATRTQVRGHNYVCRRVGCHRVAIARDPFHAFVLAALDARVITERVAPAVTRDVRAERAMEHLAAEYAAGRITRREWESARRAVSPGLEVGFDGLHGGGIDVPVARVVVTGEGFEPRLSIAVERIIVSPGRKGRTADLDRIDIRWRQ
jgi:site-specific DNA recombinase